MSEARIEAVILKQQDYRENDALITVLSKDYGKLGFVWPGHPQDGEQECRFVHAVCAVGADV